MTSPSKSEDPLKVELGFWGNLKKIFTPNNIDNELKESLEEVIEELESDEGTLGEEERSIIMNTLSFGDLRVDDVMVPRADIVAIEENTPFEEVMDVFADASTSRLPVFRETLDEVIAMVHIKDAFKLFASKKENEGFAPVKSIQRPILFVPPSMKLIDLLTKMQQTHIHMALVVDEYGGTDGLLTIEDLVEQIVGDIEDEHDIAEGVLMRELSDGNLHVDARLPIEELEDLLGIDFLTDDQDDDVDTIGGLVFTLAGHIPQKGDVIEHSNGIRFEIIEGDTRHIKYILVHRKK
ncbi:MAG: HlyC/CorC family transporter [Kordiimonadaceae bacterium]|jgi:magnesium and cobalt transporter|nr:HlyC/CorC family transporter [Kordiimonadaceae bacterium]MBT6031767.1 HlyC/CorC family transporter [Kordiimonadaceae bacterium]